MDIKLEYKYHVCNKWQFKPHICGKCAFAMNISSGCQKWLGCGKAA